MYFYTQERAGSEQGNQDMQFVAPMNVIENQQEIRYIFTMPGVSEEQTSVEVEEGYLEVQGYPRRELSSPQGYIHLESLLGSYVRGIVLPGSVDISRTQAQMRDGILEVTFRKDILPKELPAGTIEQKVEAYDEKTER